jgi:hypothetical protein
VLLPYYGQDEFSFRKGALLSSVFTKNLRLEQVESAVRQNFHEAG